MEMFTECQIKSDIYGRSRVLLTNKFTYRLSPDFIIYGKYDYSSGYTYRELSLFLLLRSFRRADSLAYKTICNIHIAAYNSSLYYAYFSIISWMYFRGPFFF